MYIHPLYAQGPWFVIAGCTDERQRASQCPTYASYYGYCFKEPYMSECCATCHAEGKYMPKTLHS